MSVQRVWLVLALTAGAASWHEWDRGCMACDGVVDGHRCRSTVSVWDPGLARYRDVTPGLVWDAGLARYREERPGRVWDPSLARYRNQDPGRPASSAYDWRSDGRHRHRGQDGWCSARH